jgi:glycosyltransferase involved in cell wall biosynthesis
MKTERNIAVFAHSCVLSVNRPIYRRMADEGALIRIYYPSDQLIPVEREEHPLISLFPLDRLGRKSRFHCYRNLTRSLDDFQPDAVLLDLEPDSLLACQLAHWCSANGAKFFVQTCENQAIWETTCNLPFPLRSAATAMRKGLLAYTRRRIDHLFPISTSGKQLLESFGFGGKITKIPLGVDTDLFRPDEIKRYEIRASWQMPDDCPVFAYFGRIIPGKGVHFIFEAFSQLTHLPWTLVIDDFEDDGSEYQNRIRDLIAAPELSGRIVRFRASHLEMPPFMNAVDVVLVPSFRHGGFLEQYGRVVPEALACGTMVITSDSGSLPEIGGDVTLRFPAGDVGSLRKLISEQISVSNGKRSESSGIRRNHVLGQLGIARQWQLMKGILFPGS